MRNFPHFYRVILLQTLYTVCENDIGEFKIFFFDTHSKQVRFRSFFQKKFKHTILSHKIPLKGDVVIQFFISFLEICSEI